MEGGTGLLHVEESGLGVRRYQKCKNRERRLAGTEDASSADY